MIKYKPKIDFQYLVTKLIVSNYSKQANHHTLNKRAGRHISSRTNRNQGDRGERAGGSDGPPLDFGRSVTQFQTGRKEGQIMPLPLPGFLALPTTLHSIF